MIMYIVMPNNLIFLGMLSFVALIIFLKTLLHRILYADEQMYVILFERHYGLDWTLPVYVNAYLALYVYSLIFA